MARSLESIIAELEPGFAGSRKTVQTQINALPGETQSQLSGLTAVAEQSHEDILGGARRRGLGFGGIPIGEQVKYDSTVFKPAVANLYSSQNSRKLSLEESLNALGRDQRTQAIGVRESELGRDLQQRQLEEQKRQFEANLAFQREQAAAAQREAAASRAAAAAQSAGIGSYFGAADTASSSGGTSGTSRMSQRKGGGFNFTDANGRAISAATYAKSKNIPFRSLLSKMASAGDTGAKTALSYVGNDFGVNRNKLSRLAIQDKSGAGIARQRQIQGILNAILW